MKDEVFDDLLKEIENMSDEDYNKLYEKSLDYCVHQCFDTKDYYFYCDKGHCMFDCCNKDGCEDFLSIRDAQK